MAGTFTFAEFKSYLKLQMGKRIDIENYDGVNLYETWVNLAYIRLTTRNRFFAIKTNFTFPQLETVDTTITTSDGVPYISVPSDCMVVRDCYDYTNKRYLDHIPWREYLKYTDRFDTTAEGEPNEWVRAGDNIYLHPTPDTDSESIYVYYRKIPAVLTGTNTTVLDTAWDEPILQLALIIGKTWLKEYPEADQMKKEWLDNVSGMMGIYAQEELAGAKTVIPESNALIETGGYRE